MGSGASKKSVSTEVSESSPNCDKTETIVVHKEENVEEKKKNVDDKTTARREMVKNRIRFHGSSKSAGNGDAEISMKLPTPGIKSPEVIEMLTESLKDFFVFSDDPSKIDIVMKTMTPENFCENDYLMHEGDLGTKLHIVESGQLEVTINGEFIRNMERGAVIGELALLYDAPRSATVKCLSDVTVWSLSRDVFKSIQAKTACETENKRARWLVRADSLAGLSPVDLSRLMNVMQERTYDVGEDLYLEGVATMKFVMILKGRVGIFSSSDPAGMSQHQIDKMHCIIRPNPTKSHSERISLSGTTNGSESSAASPLVKTISDENVRAQGPPTPLGSSRKITNGVSSYFVTEVGEGCLLGFGTMRGKGKLSDAWVFKPGEGGVSTHLAVVRSEECECLEFTLDVFERLFSNVETALKLRRTGTTRIAINNEVEDLRQFDDSKFVTMHCLGCGSFGSVTYAKYEDEYFALKTLGKAHLLDTGQLKHVLDERKLLSRMKCPFILKLYGTYQTAHKVVFVTEVLECGDLWGVIHKVDEHVANRGLPLPLAVFYAASLVIALAYIHEKGIAYRDLKPENVMLDSKGYLRIIDFGFAKIIPFAETRSSGQVEIRSKSYTLCGTPEYLAPEFVCNQGHDASVDLWALGVVIYEMFVSVTPFAARRPDNVTELFTNIANTKKNGLNLNATLDTQSRGTIARDLISNLLKPEPVERIGIKQGSTRYILEHSFFDNIDVAALMKGNVIPPYKPPKKSDFDDDMDDVPVIRPYHGNQKIFESF